MGSVGLALVAGPCTAMRVSNPNVEDRASESKTVSPHRSAAEPCAAPTARLPGQAEVSALSMTLSTPARYRRTDCSYTTPPDDARMITASTPWMRLPLGMSVVVKPKLVALSGAL